MKVRIRASDPAYARVQTQLQSYRATYNPADLAAGIAVRNRRRDLIQTLPLPDEIPADRTLMVHWPEYGVAIIVTEEAPCSPI